MSSPNTIYNSGAGLYVSDGIGQIFNNSILHATISGRIRQILCISGSRETDVGQWIGLDGTDLTTNTTDPFEISFGNSQTPGYLEISTPSSNVPLSSIHQGVYTCVIPDETGETRFLHIGLYLTGFAGMYFY